jgi:hypothetical protein
MLDDLLLRYGIENRPEASVVAWPTVVGSAVIASNKVTLTLGSGWTEAVPPVWTTPLSEAAFADETTSVAATIAAAAISTRTIMNMNVLIETVTLSFTTDTETIGNSNRYCRERVTIHRCYFGLTRCELILIRLVFCDHSIEAESWGIRFTGQYHVMQVKPSSLKISSLFVCCSQIARCIVSANQSGRERLQNFALLIAWGSRCSLHEIDMIGTLCRQVEICLRFACQG